MRVHYGHSRLGIALIPVVSAWDSGGSNGPSNPLIGSRHGISFTTQGTDYIANGIGLVLTIPKGGTYTVAFTNDLVGACNPGPNCTNGGDFVRNGHQITPEPGTADETTFTCSIQGTTLSLTGAIDDAPAMIVLDKIWAGPSRPASGL